MDRAEILSMLQFMAEMIEDAALAGAEIDSTKRDLIEVRITTVDSP